MTEEEKIAAAIQMKERGTKFLGEGKLSLALNKYNSIGMLLEVSLNSFSIYILI
jgi:hypothetical protein